MLQMSSLFDWVYVFCLKNVLLNSFLVNLIILKTPIKVIKANAIR